MAQDSRIIAIDKLLSSWKNGNTVYQLSDIAVNPKYHKWSLKIYSSALDCFYEKVDLIEKLENDKLNLLEIILQYGMHLHGLVRDYSDNDLMLGVHGKVPYFKGIHDLELWGFTNPIITRIGRANVKLIGEPGDKYTRDDIMGIVHLLTYSLPAHRLILPTVMAKLEEDGCKIMMRKELIKDKEKKL
jgi:hypothetical protein